MTADAPSTSPSTATPTGESGYGKRYWLLLLASAISLTGDGVALAAFPLLAEQVVGASAFMVSVVFAAGRLPYLFAIHAGAVVDRSDRRRLVATVEACRAVLLLSFASYVAIVEVPSLAVIIGTVFLIGVGQVLSDTTTEVVVPELVPMGRLSRANGLLYSVQSGAEQMLGPALGGVLFAVAVSLPFYVDGASYIAAALLLPLVIPPRRASTGAPAQASRLRDDVRSGVRYFMANPLLKTLAGVILTLAFCQSMVLATLVVFSSDRLDLGPQGYGALIAVTSIGNVVGSLIGGRIDSRFRTDRILVVAGVVIAATYVVAGSTASVVVVAVALFVEAVLVAVGNISSITARQKVIPPEILGRVMGAFRVLILGSIPLGSVAGGILASVVRSSTPMLFAGGLQLLAISVLGLRLVRAADAEERLSNA